jgi:chemotaxis regulatin CheY-phosphate phosphatase CheZ
MPDPAPHGAASPSQPRAPRKPSLEQAYASLEAILRASPRGRWFLAEYARRNRSAETDLLLEALERIERAVTRPAARQPLNANVLGELVEMSEAIARTRREIAQIRPPHQFDQQIVNASLELDNIVEATEKATSDILEAAEEIQEIAWTLREKGTDIALCDKIDQRATDIYIACSFQDLTGQRTGKVVKALRFIEQRINAMIEIWGVDDIACKVETIAAKMRSLAAEPGARESLAQGAGDKAEGLKQDDVDRMLREASRALSAASDSLGGRAAPESGAAPAEARDFERPKPLTLAELDPVKRASLFG